MGRRSALPKLAKASLGRRCKLAEAFFRSAQDVRSHSSFQGAAAKQASKPHRQLTHRGEFLRPRFQSIDDGQLAARHLSPRLDAKRRCGERRDMTTCRWIDSWRRRTNTAGRRRRRCWRRRMEGRLDDKVERSAGVFPWRDEPRQMTIGACIRPPSQ